jgi:hypothetical protein
MSGDGREEAGAPEEGAEALARAGAEAEERELDADGEAWLARVAGAGNAGTGRFGCAHIAAVHFFRAAEPDRPLREALLAGGRFPWLHEVELRELWARATPIVNPEEQPIGGKTERGH